MGRVELRYRKLADGKTLAVVKVWRNGRIRKRITQGYIKQSFEGRYFYECKSTGRKSDRTYKEITELMDLLEGK